MSKFLNTGYNDDDDDNNNNQKNKNKTDLYNTLFISYLIPMFKSALHLKQFAIMYK